MGRTKKWKSGYQRVWFLRFCGVGIEVLSGWGVAMRLSIPSGVGLRDGNCGEEADWRTCGDGRGNVDRRGAGSGGRGEYVSDILFEPANVEGGRGEARRRRKDAGAADEA